MKYYAMSDIHRCYEKFVSNNIFIWKKYIMMVKTIITIDGTVMKSDKIPVLVYDSKKKYYELKVGE